MNAIQKTFTFFIAPLLLGVFLSGCITSSAGKVQNLLNEGKHRKAEKQATKYLQEEPKNKKLYYNRGRARKELGRYEDAIGDFTSALEYNNNSSWTKWPLYRLGQVKMEQGEHEKAEKRFTSALEIKQNWLQALRARANAREEMADTVGAEEDRHMIHEIKVKRDREKLMEAWNELTGGAPVKDYEPDEGIGGVKNGHPHYEGRPNPFWNVPVNTDNKQCKGDSLASVSETMSELGGNLVDRSHAGYYAGETKQSMVTWKFTWWFESHPNVKFDYYRKYKFWKCPRREEMVAVWLENSWGHKPGGYYATYTEMLGTVPDYDENDIFPGHAPEYIEK